MRKRVQNEKPMPPDGKVGARIPARVEEPSLWKTREQMAIRYQVAVRTIDYWVEDKLLPTYKKGRVVRFDPNECDRAMQVFHRKFRFELAAEKVSIHANAGLLSPELIPDL